MARRAPRVCSTPNCPALTYRGGRCDDCRAQADRARGTAAERGYGAQHRNRFRRRVLARDPVCVVCHSAPSVHADHWPVDKRTLIARGLDSHDPQYGRGLCGSCHSKVTAEDHPGGWNDH